jgi:hypothetical protein
MAILAVVGWVIIIESLKSGINKFETRHELPVQFTFVFYGIFFAIIAGLVYLSMILYNYVPPPPKTLVLFDDTGVSLKGSDLERFNSFLETENAEMLVCSPSLAGHSLGVVESYIKAQGIQCDVIGALSHYGGELSKPEKIKLWFNSLNAWNANHNNHKVEYAGVLYVGKEATSPMAQIEILISNEFTEDDFNQGHKILSAGKGIPSYCYQTSPIVKKTNVSKLPNLGGKVVKNVK